MKFRTKVVAYVSVVLAMSVMASCSPRVITSVTNPLPAKEASRVAVYDEGAIVPNSAQVIGQVRVTDGGLCPTGKCRYPQVVEIAKQQTAKAGGNALYVRQHQLPDGHSTCHRITCDMLYLTDSIVDPTLPNPLMEKAAEEEKAYFEKVDNDNQVRRLPLNYISLGGGYSWLDNDVLTDDGFKKVKPDGFGYTVEYSHLWQSKRSARPVYYGFALNCIYSCVTYDNLGSFGQSMELHNTLLGVGYKMAYKTNRNFVWDWVLGLGYAHTSDDWGLNNASGLGTYGIMDVGYLIARHFCIGASFVFTTTIYSKPEGWPSDKRYGIDSGGLNVKMGYFF